jgi:hypothetical protein
MTSLPSRVRKALDDATSLPLPQQQLSSFPQLQQSDVAGPIAAGVATFGGTLAASTAVQLALGISTAAPYLATVAGFGTVCAASCLSHRAAVSCRQYLLLLRDSTPTTAPSGRSRHVGWDDDRDSIVIPHTNICIPMHSLRMYVEKMEEMRLH